MTVPSIGEALAAEQICRSVAEDMKAQNIQWRLDPTYILKLCDALRSAVATIETQKTRIESMKESSGAVEAGAPGAPLNGARPNAEIMRLVLEEIASFRPRDEEDDGARGWNRAGRYAAKTAKEALRVAGRPPVHDDLAVSNTLALFPDSTRVVVLDHEDGETTDTGLTVGLLTTILARCQAFEQLKLGKNAVADDATESSFVETMAQRLLTKLDGLTGLPEDVLDAVSGLDLALIGAEERRRTAR